MSWLATAHMVFGMQPDFTTKGRLVAREHFTDPLFSTFYFGVVSQSPVQIEFLLTGLNGLGALAIGRYRQCLSECQDKKKGILSHVVKFLLTNASAGRQ
jgi:hypothetical protein